MTVAGGKPGHGDSDSLESSSPCSISMSQSLKPVSLTLYGKDFTDAIKDLFLWFFVFVF